MYPQGTFWGFGDAPVVDVASPAFWSHSHAAPCTNQGGWQLPSTAYAPSELAFVYESMESPVWMAQA